MTQTLHYLLLVGETKVYSKCWIDEARETLCLGYAFQLLHVVGVEGGEFAVRFDARWCY